MTVTQKTKKRKSHGRVTEVMKKLRLSTHELGKDCRCKRLKCFDVISQDSRKKIIKDFNNLASHNEQSLYLAG